MSAQQDRPKRDVGFFVITYADQATDDDPIGMRLRQNDAVFNIEIQRDGTFEAYVFANDQIMHRWAGTLGEKGVGVSALIGRRFRPDMYRQYDPPQRFWQFIQDALDAEFHPDDDTYKGVAKDIHMAAHDAGLLITPDERDLIEAVKTWYALGGMHEGFNDAARAEALASVHRVAGKVQRS